MHVESEESTGDDNNNRVRGYARQCISSVEDETDNRESLTATHLETLRHEVLAHQKITQNMSDSTSQILNNQSKLQEASIDVTKEMKKGGLDAIV